MSDSEWNIVRNPEVPHVSTIPGGLMPGRTVNIKGTVLEGEKFNVDFCCGLLIDGDHKDNKALHFNPRFMKPGAWPFGGNPDRDIVINSLINNTWGAEERYTNVFTVDHQFSLRIIAFEEYFKIAVNGKHLCDYAYRVPLEQIQAICIEGCVSIDYIHFQPAIAPDGSIISEELESPVTPKIIATLEKPTIPIFYQLLGFAAPQSIQVTLTPFFSGDRFNINFMHNEYYIFHFRVDLPTAQNKQKGAIVRNSTDKNGKWLTEERQISEYPFNKGVTSDIRITAFQRSLAVDINGSPFVRFNLRGQDSLADVNRLTVNGDAVVHRIVHRG